MASWQRRLAPLIHAVEQRFDAAKYGLRRALGGPGPLHIEAYRGYGTTTELHLKGRVLEDRGIEPPGEQQSAWKNFRDMPKRVDSREQPYARLLARFRGAEQDIQADAAGMDPKRLKDEFGDRLSFHGGIDIIKTLPRGTVADVRAEVAERIRVLGRNGGYVLASSHHIQSDTPLANIFAMYELALRRPQQHELETES